MTNYAFIDSQNLNLGVRALGWRLDFERFRVYLKDKYKVTKAYLFIGYIPGNDELYKSLQESGYICIFKPTILYDGEKIKGNCDAELVLQAMIDIGNYTKAVVVTGDGDFYCLINYLIHIGKLEALLVPNGSRFSRLFKNEKIRIFTRFVADLKHKVEHKKRRPHKDETL